MEKITCVSDLKNAIQELENKQAQEWLLLKGQLIATHESFKPVNVIKNTIKEFTSTPSFLGNIFGAILGAKAGDLSKKLVVGDSREPFRNIFGSLMQFGVSNVVSRNPELIKSLAISIIGLFTKKTELKSKDDYEHSV